MQLYTESFKDFTRNPMPSIEQKNAERETIAKEVAEYLANGGQIKQVPNWVQSVQDLDL